MCPYRQVNDHRGSGVREKFSAAHAPGKEVVHDPKAEEEQMAHSRVNEYQIRIARADGTEELTRWMDSEEQLAQAMAAVHRPRGATCWLRVRNVLCADRLDQEQHIILECPITGIPSPRYRPHDSHYLVAVGSRNRYELLEGAIGSRHMGIPTC